MVFQLSLSASVSGVKILNLILQLLLALRRKNAFRFIVLPLKQRRFADSFPEDRYLAALARLLSHLAGIATHQPKLILVMLFTFSFIPVTVILTHISGSRLTNVTFVAFCALASAFSSVYISFAY